MSRGTIRYDNKTLRELDALEFYSNTAINTVPALERLHLGVPKENPAYVPGPARSEGGRPGMRGGHRVCPIPSPPGGRPKHDRRSSRLRWRAGKTRIVERPAQGCARASQKSNHGGPSALRLPCRESCSPSRRCSWEQNPPDCAAIPWRCTEARRAVRRSRSVRKRGSGGGGRARCDDALKGRGPIHRREMGRTASPGPDGAFRALGVSMRRGTAIGSVRKRGCTIH